MYFAEVVEVPLVIGEIFEAYFAGEVATVVPGVLSTLCHWLLDRQIDR